ncbi:MAG: cell division protein [Gammaproteobacteria bacterium SG8_30]|nr:MAG: cell division protein [Gammaproteobacteria bacterium SG8_30]
MRSRLVVAGLTLMAATLGARAVHLQVLDQEFLAQEGDKRYLREATVPAHRGAIVDRFGEPLAVSSPVDTVWVNPQVLAQSPEEITRLAKELKRDPKWLAQRITSNLDRQFLYVARHMDPADAGRVRALSIAGVELMREYKRYYPNGEVTGHVLGFTNLDEAGQEGLELAYNRSLAGEDGLKRVIKDAKGRIVENVESIRAPRPGEDLETSIDLRIQYLAYRELKSAVRRYRALAGSVIVLDVQTGEVLAMVNQPSFNPNDRSQYDVARYRNRAVTDIIEPGSSIKPFVLAAALDSGKYRRDSFVDTASFQVGIKTIDDKHELGTADLATILARSSNTGMARIALSLDRDQIHRTLTALGFGQVSASGFPGESAGLLSAAGHWRPIAVATIAYGYGLSVTPLQLAQAYATVGAYGLHRPVTFERVDGPPAGERALVEKVSRDLIGLLEGVVAPDGTGIKARVPGYRVAGKTGTAWKAAGGGYSEHRYTAVFAGLVPASRPRLAALVLIDEPTGTEYYGGDVAAPVFAAVMSGALRLMGVAPDDLSRVAPATVVQAAP